MTDSPYNIDQRIEKQRIDELYQRSKTASLALLITSTVYLLLLAQKFPWQTLLTWYLVLLIVLGGRTLLTRLYESDVHQVRPLHIWLRLFRLGIFAAGATIGSLSIFFLEKNSVPYVVMAIIVPYGITVGALTWLLDLYSFSLYVLTIMLPVVYQTALVTNNTGTGMLTCVLILFFLRFSKEYNRSYLLNTKLRHENKILLENLEAEKNKINNRLGRILNDSTTMIFVASAESLQCLQVNKGAIENLGFSIEEFRDISLLDIFTDLDRSSLDELLAPLLNGKGRLETIVHKGINRRKDGSTFPIEARFQLSTEDAAPIIVANVQDITERTKWEERMIYQANYDQITGLFNRHYMQSYMYSVFTRAIRHHKKVALLFMDLDNFKNINDTLGHDFGDEVLKQTAQLISSQLRKSDVAARTGGDEFTVLLENLEENVHAEVVARKIVNGFQEPFFIQGREIYTTVSVGISIYPDDGDSHDQLMQCADMAMYQAKEDGRNNYRFFSREMRQSSEKQMLISNHLRNAMAKNEFYLLFQPKIDITGSRIVGAEALLRWHNDILGEVSPNTFIPLAENLGLISDIGQWVLENACLEAMAWQQLTSERIRISVNVSPQQFRAGSLIEGVSRALTHSGLPNDQLELEITENLLLQDSDKPLAILNTLHAQNIVLALDDFGTGYSSLSYLKKFPLKVLKIDRSFIHDLEIDQNNKALVDAIIAMAHSLNLEVVAEGVENERQLEYLRERHVRIIQGYFFSPPIPANKLRALLEV